jgi:zinc finger FYVE domain-containing protein 26
MGQFELSRDLSLRCQLTLDTVWVSWGLQCLRDRKYPDAREMFRKALAGSSASGSGGASPYSSPSSRARSPSVGASSNPQSGGTPLTSPSKMMSGNLRRASSLIARTIDPQRIVEQIISTLAQSVAIVAPPPSPSPPPAAPNNEPVTPSSGEAVAKLGPDVLRECIYYLENYGTRRSLISFYIKYDMLESAIKACLAYNVDPDVFVDEVVRPCMSNSSLQDVKTIIKKIGAQKKRSHDVIFHLDAQVTYLRCIC